MPDGHIIRGSLWSKLSGHFSLLASRLSSASHQSNFRHFPAQCLAVGWDDRWKECKEFHNVQRCKEFPLTLCTSRMMDLYGQWILNIQAYDLYIPEHCTGHKFSGPRCRTIIKATNDPFKIRVSDWESIRGFLTWYILYTNWVVSCCWDCFWF